MDEGTFQEIDKFVMHRAKDFGLDKEHYLGDGVITGYGEVNGRLVYVFLRTLRYLEGRYQKPMRRKSAKLWIWR